MRRSVVLLVLVLGGCGGSFFHHATGSGMRMQTGDTYPHEVEYELLTQATGKACAAEDNLVAKRGASKDPALNGPPALFEQAKFMAINSITGADGLAAIRSQVDDQNGFLCVTVIGRAYKIAKLRAGWNPAAAQDTRLMVPKD